MIAVDQTTLVPVEGTAVGNCLQAAVASILELPLDEVPHFAALPGHWIEHLTLFFSARDLTIGCYKPGTQSGPTGVPALGCGPSPRGDWWHAVVVDAVTNELLHDPHPSRAGLRSLEEVWVIGRES